MSSRFDFIPIGETHLLGEDLEFFGEIYVYYNTPDAWFLKEFRGVLTDQGIKYRGHWEEGEDFDRLSAAFHKDPRLPETARACIEQRLNLFRRRKHERN